MCVCVFVISLELDPMTGYRPLLLTETIVSGVTCRICMKTSTVDFTPDEDFYWISLHVSSESD